MTDVNISKYLKAPLLVACVIQLIGVAVALFAMGAGGISTVFVVAGFYTALSVMCLSWLVLAVKSKILSEICTVLIIVFVIGYWLIPGGSSELDCAITEQIAVERVHKHLSDKQKQTESLGEPVFKKDKCEVWMDYEGDGGQITYIISDWGKLHIDRHDN